MKKSFYEGVSRGLLLLMSLCLDYCQMHSEVVPELMLKSEEEYRFYRELKRSSKDVDIDEDEADHSFKYGDISYSFQDGEILAVKEGRIVQKCKISDFAKKPANTFRLLRDAATEIHDYNL